MIGIAVVASAAAVTPGVPVVRMTSGADARAPSQRQEASCNRPRQTEIRKANVLAIDVAELDHGIQETGQGRTLHIRSARFSRRCAGTELRLSVAWRPAVPKHKALSRGRGPRTRRRRSPSCPQTFAAPSLNYLVRAEQIDCGIVRPSDFAVLRLMMRSYFVGCSTGRSAGLAPLRILSTYCAAVRYR